MKTTKLSGLNGKANEHLDLRLAGRRVSAVLANSALSEVQRLLDELVDALEVAKVEVPARSKPSHSCAPK